MMSRHTAGDANKTHKAAASDMLHPCLSKLRQKEQTLAAMPCISPQLCAAIRCSSKISLSVDMLHRHPAVFRPTLWLQRGAATQRCTGPPANPVAGDALPLPLTRKQESDCTEGPDLSSSLTCNHSPARACDSRKQAQQPPLNLCHTCSATAQQRLNPTCGTRLVAHALPCSTATSNSALANPAVVLQHPTVNVCCRAQKKHKVPSPTCGRSVAGACSPCTARPSAAVPGSPAGS